MAEQEKSWKPLELVKVTADYLATRDVPNPRLDAEVLLCDILGLQRRVDLYAGFEKEISGRQLDAYRELVKRRAAREPVSRILGRREFMGIEFAVTLDVLSPRPETELLVEAALDAVNPRVNTLPPSDDAAAETPEEEPPAPELMPEELERLLDSYAEDVDDEADIDRPAAAPSPARPRRNAPERPAARAKGKSDAPAGEGRTVRVLDLGTGSGCIAVALAARSLAARVVALDASPKALAVAKKNAARAGVAERVEFRQGDWFAGCRPGERFDIILSNPPYLVEGDKDIWPEVSRYDPPAALYGGGPDGLDCYRRIIPEAPEWLVEGGRIFIEVGAGQAGRVAELLRRRGFGEVNVVSDYGGVERVVTGRLEI